MSGDVVERVAAELREHGYGGATCTRDERKEYCQCGWSSTQHDHETHLGDVVAEALQLREEQYRSAMCPDELDYDRVRWVSPWVGVLSEQGSGQ